ncbi:type I restriction endonuclease subunit R [Sapientia aquatica]|uniref:Type I restriction enzyme endonuclease subunit n=1 Tax=Sapientia aquatica TaxID=1549640 RepID=A0A4R5VTF6_9BURK|nr:type I restriction endonuclease subunit R [Sapientia aquatica]TDK61197.1 type I restriction endonuclease subunit R [Sapientia aquatica]
MANFISEDQIEQRLLKELQEKFGFALLNCHTVLADDINDQSGRSNKRDVIFADRLKAAAVRLNPHIPEVVIDDAVAGFCDRRSAKTLIAANRELDGLIRGGIAVEYENAQGKKEQERVRLIDFNPTQSASSQNEYLAVSQLWIKGEHGYRRPDVLLYVNGIPLVFIELKNSSVKLRTAFDDNLTTYKKEIPQLFLTNAFCIFSNAIETRVGSITSQWEHFFTWLRVEDEKEKINREKIAHDQTSLEFAIAGLCAPDKLLDYVENFILYFKETSKIIAQNHQFIGVNNAIEKFAHRRDLQGRLGVFWHTQGSGKSFSMIFYARKIFRKMTGNFTFVVVTDRDDLDGQIYRNFLNTETVQKHEAAQPKNSEELRKFLGQNKRTVFTLIQKFRYDKGRTYPVLSERDDIIVIVDEAHRTQYASLAENMRAGLPNANFLAFTGTPLLGKERKTNKWFGDYVSEYNFQQSMDDGATVPLFYQKRVPSVLIQNEDLSEEFYEILDDENLDEKQAEKLEGKFAKEVEVIKRDDRLETIAKDIVAHFPNRGYLGKGMMIAIDKFTAVRMYDKVQRLWKEEIKQLVGQIAKATNPLEKSRLKKRRDYMNTVQMAVVISEEAGEEDKFKKQKLDVKPHRDRMTKLDGQGHDIEYNFKDPEDPLQLVFVCAMWLTGFDAPTVSTLYLDKPMKDHTLMQTIARANRVTSWQINGVSKLNGEVVDYYNVFRNMKKALKDYAQGLEGQDEEPPVQEKTVLFKLLDDAIEQGLNFCSERDVRLDTLLAGDDVFTKLGRFNEFANTLLGNEEWRKGFMVYQNTISSLYEACKPEVLSRGKGRIVAAFEYLRGVLDSIVEQVDIDSVSQRIAELLDESVVVDGDQYPKQKQDLANYAVIHQGKTWDLSKIDFDKLRDEFSVTAYKNIEIADLRAFVEHKLQLMLAQNATRSDFAQRLQQIIDKYNAGGTTVENYYEDLMNFTADMKSEDERHIREGLTEDELELFDLLKKDGLTKAEEQKVKLAAKSLLHRLLEEQPKVLIQDWFKDSQSQKIARSAVEIVLNNNLPDSYDRVLFREKCDDVFELMLDYAQQGKKWAAHGAVH